MIQSYLLNLPEQKYWYIAYIDDIIRVPVCKFVKWHAKWKSVTQCMCCKYVVITSGLLTGASIQSEDRSNGLQAPVPLLKSHSDTELTAQEVLFPTISPPHMGGTSPNRQSPNQRERHLSGESMPRIQISDGSVTMSLGTSQDFPTSYSSSPQPQERGRAWTSDSMPLDPSDRDSKKAGEIRKSFNAAFSGLSKLTEKVKQNVKALDVSDDADDWDSISIKSGASSDDEEFVFLKLQNASEVPAFEHRHSSMETVSVAGSDGRDADSGSMTMSSAGERARGVVSDLRRFTTQGHLSQALVK